MTVQGTGTYGSSVGKRIGSLVGGLVVTLLVAIIVPKFFLDDLLDHPRQEVLLAICGGILLVGLVMTVVRSFVTGPVRIVTTPAEVVVYRGGRQRERWSRAGARFASFVVRESANGIRTGTTRKLIVTTRAERVEVVCTWFSAATFNALLADVSPVVPGSIGYGDPAYGDPSGGAVGGAAPHGTFTLDRRPWRRQRTVMLVTVGVAILAMIAVAVMAQQWGDAGIAMFLLIGTAIVVLLCLIPLFGIRRLPTSVAVSPSAIEVDGKTYPLHQLAAVVATPPGYTSGQRSLTLVEVGGSRTRVGLGRNTPGARGNTFPDYPRFLETLVAATAHRPGFITFDLA